MWCSDSKISSTVGTWSQFSNNTIKVCEYGDDIGIAKLGFRNWLLGMDRDEYYSEELTALTTAKSFVLSLFKRETLLVIEKC